MGLEREAQQKLLKVRGKRMLLDARLAVTPRTKDDSPATPTQLEDLGTEYTALLHLIFEVKIIS